MPTPAPVNDQHDSGVNSTPSDDELDLARLDLLAEVLRRAADHQPADEDRQQDVEQHRVQAGADAAEDRLAVAEVRERDEAADAGERLERGVDRAARDDGRDRRQQRRVGDAEALLLALHVAAVPPRCRVRPLRCAGVPCCSAT